MLIQPTEVRLRPSKGRFAPLAALLLCVALSSVSGEARAQWAVGHRVFGGGTSVGLGYDLRHYNFNRASGQAIGDDRFWYLLPTLELKVFFSDKLSLDLSVPVVNIAASNVLRDYFFFTSDLYLGIHPNAPSSVELFIAPGLGVTYASFSDGALPSRTAYAFHIPVRVGVEMNSSRRGFSFFAALRPFFSIVRGADAASAGGGVLLEIGVLGYAVTYQADRY